MTTITISAPGKVIIHGEHSVVYGKLAIASSINKSTHLHLTEIETNQENQQSAEHHERTAQNSQHLTLLLKEININLKLPKAEIHQQVLPNGELPLLNNCQQETSSNSSNFDNFNLPSPENINHEELVEKIKTYIDTNIKFQSNDEPQQKNALLAFFYLYFGMLYPSIAKIHGLVVEMSTNLPIGAGLGSSASFSVCLAAGFLELLKKKAVNPDHKVLNVEGNVNDFSYGEKCLISRWAFEAERVTHGNPSGLDNTVCTFGGFVEYRKQEQPKQLRFDGMIPPLECLLIDTKVPKNTKAQVQKVAKLKEQFSGLVERILDAMEEISKSSIELLQAAVKDYDALNKLFDINQNMLQSLNVSHPKIEEVCSILREFHLHAKITGAGGGGYVLCLVPTTFDKDLLNLAMDKLQCNGFVCDFLSLGADGVRVEQ